MKRFKKVLSLLLVICMVFSMNLTAFAEEPVEQSDTASDDFYKIVHLDCGRKYFTTDWVINLIGEMKKDGYTHLELAIGNDGLRFLLDDMSVIVDGTTYASEKVTEGIQAGNKAYYDAGTKNEWTQSEMDTIIDAANNAGIQIIPLVNTPGHMDAIIDAMEAVGISGSYNGSARTVDVTNDTAVAFTQALVGKYVSYFAAKGCKVFNIGADEYANDIYSSGGMGFGQLSNSGKYGSFVTYVNGLAAIIKNAGMTPMAFNDGIYYNSTTSYGTFDQDIMIAYWSPGWIGYNVASAEYLANQGHKLINTHGDFYYVLGKDDKFDNGNSYASNWNNKVFAGTTTGTTFDEEPAGAMFCIWCDYPGAETEAEITSKVIGAGVLSAMSKMMGHEKTEEVVDATVTNGENTISVTGPGLTSIVTNKVATPSYSAEGATVVGYDITPYVNGVAYTGSGSVTIAVPAELKVFSNIKVYDVEKKTFVTSSISNGMITFNATHFSEYDVVGYSDSEIVPDKTITLEIGGTATETQENVNNSGNVDRTNLNESIATVEVTGVDGTEAGTVYTEASVTCNTLISSNSNSWVAASGYYYTPDNGKNYYPVYAKRTSKTEGYLWWQETTYTYTWGYSTTDSSSNVTKIKENTQSTTNTGDEASITVYTKSGTAATPASTSITFTGKASGTTYVAVGEITYKIVVNYKTETVTAYVGQPTTVTVSGNADTSALNTNIAKVSVSGNTMTVTGVAVGDTTVTVGNTIYSIKVIEEDLSIVNPLTIEYWITNRQVIGDNNTSKTIYASDENVHSENGILLSSTVPSQGSCADDSNAIMVFWKGTYLDSDNKQTSGDGVDKTTSGIDFNYIRYWNNSWAYSSDGKNWTNIISGNQLVAYYLQETTVTKEVKTQVVDWGPQKSNWSGLNYLGKKYVLLDYTVKYESGEEVPSSFSNENSLAFHCDTSTTNNNYYYRTLGMIRAEETTEYEVYMITLTPTSDNTSDVLASTAAANNSYSYSGTEVVAWAATQEDLNASGLGTYTSISGKFKYSIGGEPIVSGLEIYRQQGMKVTYYVRAKVTEDSLSVHYVDQTANQEFYNYNIAVKSGTVFDRNIALANPWKANLENGSVVNYLGNTQNVSADLSTMPAIGAQYRYSDYTCTSVVRTEGGKEVYLYYTFNNAHSFVVDFGLPLQITTEDVGISGNWTSATVTGAQYGEAVVTVGNGLTYTPTKPLTGIETLQLTLTGDNGSVTHQIYIYPATTVYYEEGFATFDGFTVGSTESSKQATQVAGESSDNYGYDAAYEKTGASEGTQATADGSATATFTFTGTGIELYTNNTTNTGNLMAKLYLVNADGSTTLKKTVFVETAQKNGSIITGQEMAASNEPVVVWTNLAYGNYKLVVTNSKVDSVNYKKINIDGFRVFDTLNDNAKGEGNFNSYYVKDKEENPTFIEMRNQVIATLVAALENSDEVLDSSLYKKQIAEYIHSQIYATGDADVNGPVIISNSGYTNNQLQDLLDNGPKNEIYLQQGQALSFKVNTERQVQLGMKVVNNQSVKYTLNGVETTLTSGTDMFYDVPNNNKEVTIVNPEGSGAVIGITLLKICDDPNAVFAELTEEDIEEAVGYLYGEDAPEEPEVTYADATLTVKVNDAEAILTKNGVVGENAIFTAAEIEEAAVSLVADGYELKDVSYSDIEVAYGETDEISFAASEEVPDTEEGTDSSISNILDKIFAPIKNFFGKLFGR